MIRKIHLVLLLSSYSLYCQQFKPRSFDAVRTESRPKTSCHAVSNIPSKTKCFLSCLKALDVHYMFSYNKNLHSCLCCNDLSGNDIPDLAWKTYRPRPCQDGYVTYNYTDFQTCLKYVPESVRYSQARAYCEAEGADLIKIASLEKFEIFKEILAPFSAGVRLDVWIQAVKDEQTWRFHDGSQVPDIFSIDSSDKPGEIYLRAISDYDFKWYDAPDGDNYHFMCEYYRQFRRPVPIGKE